MQKEINLKVLFSVIKKRLWLILIITAIATTASGYYSSISKDPPPVYQSSTSILLNTIDKDALSTLEVILRDPAVLDKVVGELGLNKSLDELNKQINFANEGGSKIVNIMVADTNPELAAQIANSTANIFTKQMGSILGIYDTKILSEAQVSSTPSSVGSESTSLLKYLVIGFGAGLVLSIGIVLFLDSLDETVQSEREIEQLLEFPVLGYVSKMNGKNTKSKNKKRVVQT
ncbi:YveK family protein [Bacillus songklensis]|uniref:YveK family protein n=1 Tax=Bacillus songklensis TaxID=1069116 RepID=A0ABV8B5Z6_9BACI